MKLAIITGGSRGLGKALAEKMDEEGWKTLELSRSGTSPSNVRVDLADLEAVQAVFEGLLSGIEVSAIDECTLVHNAGAVTPIKGIGNLAGKEIERSICLNVTAPIHLTNEFVRKFRDCEVEKSIVNISSGAASKGYAGWGLYCAGKAGFENFMRSLFEQEKLKDQSFRVMTVNPFVMDTEMQAEIRGQAAEDFPQVERFNGLKNDGTLLDPRVVARIVAALVIEKTNRDSHYDVREFTGKET